MALAGPSALHRIANRPHVAETGRRRRCVQGRLAKSATGGMRQDVAQEEVRPCPLCIRGPTHVPRRAI